MKNLAAITYVFLANVSKPRKQNKKIILNVPIGLPGIDAKYMAENPAYLDLSDSVVSTDYTSEYYELKADYCTSLFIGITADFNMMNLKRKSCSQATPVECRAICRSTNFVLNCDCVPH